VLIVWAGTLSFWMRSGAEGAAERRLVIWGREHLDKDVVPVSTGTLEDLKVRRRSEIIVDFGFNFLLGETRQSLDSNWTYTQGNKFKLGLNLNQQQNKENSF